MSKSTTRARRAAAPVAPTTLPDPENSAVATVAPTVAAPAKPARKSMKGINASGNSPWRKKLYSISETYTADAARTYAGQVQGILRYMAESKAIGRGGDLCAAAIEGGFITTRIAPDVLFAYYRKTMEDAGFLKFVGYTA